VVFVLEELVLYVAIPDAAGDAAQFFEASQHFLALGFIRGEALDHSEEFELGLDAAGGRAELVDGFCGGSGDSYGERGFEAFGLFA
jgi:hypothetical protein